MFDAIRTWFSPARESSAETKWDANTLAMQQPDSPAALEMNQTVTQQPVWIFFRQEVFSKSGLTNSGCTWFDECSHARGWRGRGCLLWSVSIAKEKYRKKFWLIDRRFLAALVSAASSAAVRSFVE